MPKPKKNVPPTATARHEKRDVRISEPPSGPYPAWRFSTADLGGPFSWPKGSQDELEIVKKLTNFDSMKWTEIEGSTHHSLSEGSLSSEALNRLQEIGRDDEIDSIFSFRVQGAIRIICIRDRNIAKLLWYDPQHNVCPSTKK